MFRVGYSLQMPEFMKLEFLKVRGLKREPVDACYTQNTMFNPE